jgi:hypothetical protein
MDTVPTPGPSVVTRAVLALNAFGDEDLDRERAAKLIRMWRYFRDLTAPDVEEVLRHFPVGEPDPYERPLPGGGMSSGAMILPGGES